MRIERLVALLLFVCGVGFSLISFSSIAHTIFIASTWPTIEGKVLSLSTDQSEPNTVGITSAEIQYVQGAQLRTVWVFSPAPKFQQRSFIERFQVGTRHKIWLNPEDPTKAEVQVGFNLDSLSLAAMSAVAAVILLVIAKRFWDE